MINIRAYNEAYAAGDGDTMEKLKTAMGMSLTLLHKVRFFELFTPDEWMAGSNEGRKLVGQMYVEFQKSLA
jgi:hypothetical protein